MMEASQVLCGQDPLQVNTEKRQWQKEVESRKRQLEDDRRALQHLKSKALRERWLLEGAPSAGPDQDDTKKQLEQDEAKTRSLEETINRLEVELLGLLGQTATQTTMSTGSNEVQESLRMNKPREKMDEMKRAVYSVEIKVERDHQTGESRILSTNTTLPVDLSQQGVKVYEDEQKVVHEMNGEDGVHLLSSSEVDELIFKADKALMMTQTASTVTSMPTAEYQEEVTASTVTLMPTAEYQEEVTASTVTSMPTAQYQEEVEPELPHTSMEITGLEAEPQSKPSVAEASTENPVTMVFMGYQSVEDEAETKKVLGLQGTVTAELVLIDDCNENLSPGEGKTDEDDCRAQTTAPHPLASKTSTPLTTSIPPMATTESNKEQAGEGEGRALEIQKEKRPCKCCTIM